MTPPAQSDLTQTTTNSSGIFYGWWIVGGALVAQMVAVSIMSSSSGIFLPFMTEELGWTQTEFTLGVTLGSISTALAGGVVGFLLDRWGPRGLMIAGATLVGLSLIYLSRITTLLEWFLIRGVVSSLGLALAGNLVLNVVIAKWFVSRRSWAISIASTGVSAAQFTGILLVWLISTIGWRDSWIVLGVVTWLVLYPVALMMRRQPEDHGLLPDGAVEGDASSEQRIQLAREDMQNSLTAREAAKTLSLWTIQIGFSFGLMGLMAGLFFLIPFMTLHGFTFQQAGTAMLFQGLAALASKFVWPVAMGKIGVRLSTLVAFSLAAIGMVLMVIVGPTQQFVPFVLVTMLWGFGIGSQIPLQESLMASFFGRAHLGAVRGISTPISQAFGISAPIGVAFYFDRVGNYDGIYLALAAGFILGALLVMSSRKPVKPSQGRDTSDSVTGTNDYEPTESNSAWPSVAESLSVNKSWPTRDSGDYTSNDETESINDETESINNETQSTQISGTSNVGKDYMRSGISSRAKLLDGQRFDYGFQATGLNSETIRAESKKNLNVEMANESSNRQPDGMGTNMDSATSDGQWAEIELRPSGDAIARLSKLILSKDERIKEILPAAAVAVAASVAVVAIFRMRKPK
jgi:MFS family permease